jgi:hypothetical protein
VATDEIDAGELLEEIVDYVMQVLPPYETSVYLFLLRKSWMKGSSTVRIGKRSIGEGLGKGTRSRRGGNYQHIDDKLRILAREGFIAKGDVTRLGTLYTVFLPSDVPVVRNLMSAVIPKIVRGDYYAEPDLREELFDRDGWRCQYCADRVTEETVTLDHLVPVSKGGTNEPENLVTTCLICNSLKSGRTYEEAAADILSALSERRNEYPAP